MPKRTDISSILVIGAALAASSCTKTDWREGFEDPEECVARLYRPGEDIFSQTPAQNFIWVPTFTFDITMMDNDARQALIKPSGASHEDETTSSLSVDKPAATTGKNVDVQKSGAQVIVLGQGGMHFRMRDRPVAIANAAAAGCALQRPDMRLVSINMTPPTPGSEKTDASAKTVTEIGTE